MPEWARQKKAQLVSANRPHGYGTLAGLSGNLISSSDVKRALSVVDIDAELWRRKPGEDPFGDQGGRGRLFGELVAVRYELVPGLREWTIRRRFYVEADRRVLEGQPGAVDQVKRDTLVGIAALNERRSVLPDVGLPLRWDSRTDHWRWAAGRAPEVYFHEVVHGAGVRDDAESSLMGGHGQGSEVVLSEGDLKQMVDTLAPYYAGVRSGGFGPGERSRGVGQWGAGPGVGAGGLGTWSGRAAKLPRPYTLGPSHAVAATGEPVTSIDAEPITLVFLPTANSEATGMATHLDAQVEAFRNRPLDCGALHLRLDEASAL